MWEDLNGHASGFLGGRPEKPGVGILPVNYGFVKCEKIISGKGTKDEVVCDAVYEKFSPNTRYCPACRKIAEKERTEKARLIKESAQQLGPKRRGRPRHATR